MVDNELISRCAEANLHRILIKELLVMVFNLQEELRTIPTLDSEGVSVPHSSLEARIIALRNTVAQTIVRTTFPSDETNADAIRRLAVDLMKEFFMDLEGPLLPVEEMSV